MPVDWAPLVKLIKQHQHILITTHVRPDGDGLGSGLALADVLKRMGKEPQLVISSKFPPRYQFMDEGRSILRYEPPGRAHPQAELVIVLDTGTWNQLGDFGDFLKNFSGPKAVVDHHQTQDDLGAERFVDTAAEATGRLTHELIEALDAPLSAEAASHLFVALAMDTGWFRHSNTTPKTFALAAKLQEEGAEPTKLYTLLFEQISLARQHLTGRILERLQVVHDGRTAYSELYCDDYRATGAVPQDTEDMINHIRSVAGPEVAIFLMEQPAGGVKISFRSRSRVDVAHIAERFGGGGHRLASGATIDADPDQAREQVLDAVREALAE